MDANLVASWSTTDGVPSQSSFEQAATEHACRALFEEWIDLDDTLHRASCVPDPAQPLGFARSPPSALTRQGGAPSARAHLVPPLRTR